MWVRARMFKSEGEHDKTKTDYYSKKKRTSNPLEILLTYLSISP
jgi:hypothetical protein